MAGSDDGSCCGPGGSTLNLKSIAIVVAVPVPVCWY